MPSPSINGIIGWSGTFRVLSGLTVIFSPKFGTVILDDMLDKSYLVKLMC
jgi:hypothetical protein